MGELLPCPFCGGEARILTRTDECLWSNNQVEWTAISCSGRPDFDCFQPSVDWPTSATDDNDTQLSISQWNRRALTAAPAEDVRAGAQVLLKWIDDLTDPYALALAISQAQEAGSKASYTTANLDAANAAFARRFVESIALDNAGLIRKLTPPGEAKP